MTQSAIIAAKNAPYFKPDNTYDPRFYNRTVGNVILVIGVFILMYSTVAAIWTAIFFFGIHKAKWMGIFNLIVFGLTVLFIAWMLYQGSVSNAYKREHDFWVEQIHIRTAKIAEEETKVQQQQEYDARLREEAEKAALINNPTIQEDARH